MEWKIALFLCLFAAFILLFVWIGKIRILLRRTFESMNAAARRREQDNRKNLVLLQKQKGFLYRMEQRLVYCGLIRRFPFLTVEIWLLVNLAMAAGIYFMIVIGMKWIPFFGSNSWLKGLIGVLLLQGFRYLAESLMMGRNYRSVNENLLKFLDFLGNYSITAGEVTGILNQISRYVDEPLRSVLDECYYEAQTSGDAALALLSMAEKIEHPRFKELVRNMEISIRYSADFTALVTGSRRAIREHMRTRQERKALANEAIINILILAGMSVVVLASVEQLIGASIWEILLHTLPGQIGLAIIFIIFGLLFRQIRNIDR